MGQDIEVFHVKQFHDSIILLAQQKVSRLAATIVDRGNITGASFTANRLAALDDDGVEVTNRFGDTVLSQADHSVRQALMRDFFKALGVDKFDEPKVLANPSGEYMTQLVSLWNRWQDKLIFEALLGNSLTDDGTIVTLPSEQIILHGGTGLTKGKIIQAKATFRDNEADEHNEEELFIAYDSAMLIDILSDTDLTDIDKMAVKMLQDGAVASKWCGVNWIPYNGVKKDGDTRTTAMWAKSAAHRGTGLSAGNITRRADKRDLMQVSKSGSMGVTRVDEQKVVAIEYKA